MSETRNEQASPASGTTEGVAHPRTIRSFVLRAGRTTTGQAKAFETNDPYPYLLDPRIVVNARAGYAAERFAPSPAGM